MSYVYLTSACVACGRLISYNPARVPSLRVNGVREPVCRACVESANARLEPGQAPFVIHPEAYEPLPEKEFWDYADVNR